MHCGRIRKLAQATAAGVRIRPGRVYMMEFKVIFVIGIVVERIMDETVRFEEMGLSEEIQKAVRYMGFEEASPIQAKAIPAMISGIDLIGQAQTGTGKTAAFGIPLLEKVDPKLKKLQAIVLCPTRELAIQVADEIRNLSRYMHGIKVLPIYGGQDIVKQIRSLKSGTQIVIGTPGRVMDHMRRKTMKLDLYTRLCLMKQMKC